MTSLMGLYRPGSSLLHRLPAGVKVGALVVAGAGSALVRTPTETATALGGVGLGYAAARVPPRVVLGSLRPLLWVVVPLGAIQVVWAGWQRAFVVLGVIVALVLLANLVTLTSRTSDLVDVVVRVSNHLAPLGVRPERIGLVLNLGIRAVPLVVELAERVRDAQLARGSRVSPRTLATPLIVLALRRAEQIGGALAARGLDD